MKEDLNEMRRLLRLLVLLLFLTCFALIAASIALMRTQCFILQEEKMLLNVRNAQKDVTRHAVNTLPEPLARKDYKQYMEETNTAYQIGSGGKQTKYNIVDSTISSVISNGYHIGNKFKTSKEDLFITIKTTKKYHSTRLRLIGQTWYSLAPNQTLFVSDAPVSADEVLPPSEDIPPISSRVHVTDCPSTHNRKALCCKMAWELDAFLESSAKWWCHFDDDNYVNVKALVKTLDNYDYRQLWYLGRPSIRAPLEILNRDDVTQKIAFWFATGGAGFCVSRALALKMMPIAGGGKLISIGDKIRLPDDVTVGYIIEHLLHHKLTVLDQFHSHLESMQFLDQNTLSKQISLSYSTNSPHNNLLSITGLHPKLDPTRMLSLHCLLYPDTSYCPR